MSASTAGAKWTAHSFAGTRKRHDNAPVPHTTIGLRAKTGRAIAIVLTGDRRRVDFVWRGEITLVDRDHPATGQPYHELMHLPWSESVIAVQPLIEAIERVAEIGLGEIVRANGITAVGVVGAPPRNLARIGNEHIRAHAAEGTLFRQVLEVAAKRLGLPCCAFTEKEIEQLPDAQMKRIGKEAGRPWRIDERLAASAAWQALNA